MEPRLIADLEDNAARFVRRVVANELVYFADCDEGLLTCSTVEGEERAIITCWSDAAYVRQALTRSGLAEAYVVRSEPLAKFLFESLPGFDRDGVLIGPNFTADTMAGIEFEPHDLFKAINAGMSEPEREKYAALSKQQR